MASRLSEEQLTETLDGGWRSLALATSPGRVGLEPLDLDKILESADARKIVQRIPARKLWSALTDRGLEDSLELLPMLSRRQFQKMIDYEAWEDDRLSIARVSRWLQLYRAISPQQLHERFRQMDEECQLALLGPLVETFDEEQYERMSDAEQDRLYRMPCGTLWYQVKSDEPATCELIQALIEASVSADMAWTYSLLGHASWMPPNEQEDLALQFRTARIEEDGFVPYAEAVRLFMPPAATVTAGKWSVSVAEIWDQAAHAGTISGEHALVLSSADAASSLGTDFLGRTMSLCLKAGFLSESEVEHLQRRLTHLGNGLATASRIEPDNQLGLKVVTTHLRALLSLSLDALSGSDESRAKEILRTEHPLALFQFALALVEEIRRGAITQMASGAKKVPADVVEKISRQWRQRRFGLLLDTIDRHAGLDFEEAEILKGLFNRWPLVAMPVKSTDDGVPARWVFRPPASLADLGQLRQMVEGVVGGPAVEAAAPEMRLVSKVSESVIESTDLH